MRKLVSARGIFAAAVIAAVLMLGGFTSTAASAAAEKKVDITVEVHGNISGVTVKAIEDMVEEWLEAAHFAVVNADGVDILELHIVIEADDDGKGFEVHSECGEWKEEEDVDAVDAIDDILHKMIDEFIEKFVK